MDERPQPIEAEGMFDDLNPGAILFGALVDIIATLLCFVVLVAVLAAPAGTSEEPEAAEAAFEAASSSPEFLLASLVLGAACTVLGSFVGSRRAGIRHMRHGGWIAVASAALGALFYLVPSDEPAASFPLWYDAVGWGLLLPAGLLGGALAEARQRRRGDPGPSVN